MRIIISREKFLGGLQKVLGPTTTKQNNPILNTVLIETHKEKIKLITTDLDTTTISSIEATIQKTGKTATPLKQLVSIVRELPAQDVVLELNKNNLFIRCEQVEFKVNVVDVDEFPKIDIPEKTSLIKIHAQELLSLTRLTSFCVGYEDTNYVLNGILFEVVEDAISAVATDGKRLSFAKTNLSTQQPPVKTKLEFILPIKTINEVQKLIKDKDEDIFFFVNKNKVGFDVKETQIVSKPIEGEFPDYSQYIPKPSSNKLTIDRRNFLASLRRAALLTTVDYQSVKLDLTKNEMVLSKTTPQLGEVKEKIACQYTGKALQIGFNPHYLIDVLRTIDYDVVDFEFYDADKPAVIRKNNFTYLVLPMRI